MLRSVSQSRYRWIAKQEQVTIGQLADFDFVDLPAVDKLQATAFLNPDGKMVVVVLNTSDQKLPFRLWIDGKAAETVSLPHSIMTAVI